MYSSANYIFHVHYIPSTRVSHNRKFVVPPDPLSSSSPSSIPTPSLLLLFSHSVVSNSFATPWTVACQASLSKGFSQQEYWSGLPFHSPGALPGPRLKSKSPALAGRFSTTKPPGKPYTTFGNHKSNLFFCLFLKYN